MASKWTDKLKKGFDLFKKDKDKPDEGLRSPKPKPSPSVNAGMKKIVESVVMSRGPTVELAKELLLPAELVDQSSARLLRSERRAMDTDEQVLSVLDPGYFRNDFDPLPLVLSSLPEEYDPETLQLWVMKCRTENVVVSQIVEENLNKEIQRNYNGFIEGARLFNEFDLDIHRAEIAATNGRRRLNQLYSESVEGYLKTAALVRRLRRMQHVRHQLALIERYFSMEKEITAELESSESGSLVQKIQEFQQLSRGLPYDIVTDVTVRINLQIAEVEKSLDRLLVGQFWCSDVSVQREVLGRDHFRSENDPDRAPRETHVELDENGEEKPAEDKSKTFFDFNWRSYSNLLKSFIEFDSYQGNRRGKKGLIREGKRDFDSGNFGVRMKDQCVNALEQARFEVVRLYLKKEPRAREATFLSLCSELDLKDVLRCFLALLTAVTKILFTYHVLVQFHKRPFEEESGSLSSLHSLVEEHSLPESETRKISFEGLEVDARAIYKISKEMDKNRPEIWHHAQQLIAEFLEYTNIHSEKYKMTNWFNILDNLAYLKQFGNEFCEGKTEDIDSAILGKGGKYFEFLHEKLMENFKVNLSSESWVKLDTNTSEHSVSDLVSMYCQYSPGQSSETPALVESFFVSGNFFFHRREDSTQPSESILPAWPSSDEFVLTSSLYNGFGKAVGNAVQFMRFVPHLQERVTQSLEAYVSTYIYVVFTVFTAPDTIASLFKSDSIRPRAVDSYPMLLEVLRKGYRSLFHRRLEANTLPTPPTGFRRKDLKLDSTGYSYPFNFAGNAVESVDTMLSMLMYVYFLCRSMSGSDMLAEKARDSEDTYRDAIVRLRSVVYGEASRRMFSDIAVVSKTMSDIKYDMKSLPSKLYAPVERICGEPEMLWQRLYSSLTSMTIASSAVVHIWDEIVNSFVHELYKGIASIRKCSDVGRDYLLKLVQYTETKCREQHEFGDYGTFTFDVIYEFIQAYHIQSADEFLDFVRRHHQSVYEETAVLNLLNSMNRFNRKDTGLLTQEIKSLYK